MCVSAYFLHSQCGYTFTPDGYLWELTPTEEEMLWTGWRVWMEHFNPETAQATDSGQKGSQYTKGDEKIGAWLSEQEQDGTQSSGGLQAV